MKKRVIFSICIFITSGFIGLVILRIYIPKPPDQGIPIIVCYLAEFFFVCLGPLPVLSIANSETGPIVGSILILSGLSVISFIKIIKNKNVNIAYVIIPIVFWCGIGTIGTIWAAWAAI